MLLLSRAASPLPSSYRLMVSLTACPKKGATGGLPASANRVNGKTLLDKPAVASEDWAFSRFWAGCS